jgi:uncharacterized Fe-S cluster protein YjdI
VGRKEYRAGESVVSYDPDVCIHAAECVRGLPKVFDPEARPWIRPENAAPDDIRAVVALCPSGALEFRRERPTEVPAMAEAAQPAPTKITALPNGPYIVEGKLVLKDPAGTTIKEGERFALCRCGQSVKKPFCDGTHGRVGFQAP